jgi:FKBP-type peptidyl-prolyl cis-trans isomerase
LKHDVCEAGRVSGTPRVAARVATLGAAALGVASLSGCFLWSKPKSDAAGSAESASATATEAAPQVTTLQITDVKPGTGAEAAEGKKLTVHYTGTLEGGTQFDSSKEAGEAFTFVLGSGTVIAGWEQGIRGMKEGGIRRLVIPASLAYGARSAMGGKIPPNSALTFEIELLKVE